MAAAALRPHLVTWPRRLLFNARSSVGSAWAARWTFLRWSGPSPRSGVPPPSFRVTAQSATPVSHDARARSMAFVPVDEGTTVAPGQQPEAVPAPKPIPGDHMAACRMGVPPGVHVSVQIE